MAKNEEQELEDLKPKLISLPEVKVLLLEEEKKGTITPEKRFALEHAAQFSKLTVTKAKKLIKKLMKLDRVSEYHAYKIVEILPGTPDEVRLIFARDRFAIEEKVIKEILEYIAEVQ